MIKIIRTTADRLPTISDEEWKYCGLVVHMISSLRPMTVGEIINEVNKYNEQFGEPMETKEEIFQKLIASANFGFIKATIEEK